MVLEFWLTNQFFRGIVHHMYDICVLRIIDFRSMSTLGIGLENYRVFISKLKSVISQKLKSLSEFGRWMVHDTKSFAKDKVAKIPSADKISYSRCHYI